MSRARNAIVSPLVLLLGRRRSQRDPGRVVPESSANASAEIAVLLLLGLTALSALGFVLVYAFANDLGYVNQLLGATIGLAFLFLAAAFAVVGLALLPGDEHVEDYPASEHPAEQQVLVGVLEQGSSRFTRSRLFKAGLAGAGGALGLGLLAPVVSWGPLFRVGDYLGTPWRRGRRLVDPNGQPYKASDIQFDDFYDAFPEHLSASGREQLAASVLLVRLPADSLDLPLKLRNYPADGGIVAYSKICTHAGCAIAMYRAPLFQPDEPTPALVCPCHYSTFDPADGGKVLFGPAGRALPMLPIYVDTRGYLRAAGTFDGPVGPSWWGARIYGQHFE